MLELTLRLVASLAVVVGLLLVTAKVLGRQFKTRNGAAIQVLHRQPLTRSTGVAVVTVGNRVLVLGTTDHQVNVLAELDPEELLDDDATVTDLLAVREPLEARVEAHAEARVEARVEARPGGAHRAPRPMAATGADGALNGSILSPQTWRQAFTAATRRVS